MKLNHTIERPPIALLPRHGASAHARTSGQATDTARALTIAAPAAAWLPQGTVRGHVVPAPVLPARVILIQEVSLSNCGSKGSSVPAPGRWVASPATNGGSMSILEWLARRAVEAVVMAVVVGTVVLSLLAMSGEFGETVRLNQKRYPDHIITKSK